MKTKMVFKVFTVLKTVEYITVSPQKISLDPSPKEGSSFTISSQPQLPANQQWEEVTTLRIPKSLEKSTFKCRNYRTKVNTLELIKVLFQAVNSRGL
jgi:hypothetical protein